MLVNILCLDNPLGAWDESSLQKGVGGSETAVIGLAKIMGENKHEVNIYNDVENIVNFGQVSYFPKTKPFSPADLWIVWRSPADLLKIRNKSGKKVLWLHDLMPESEVIQYQHFCDKIWVPSYYHRGYYPHIPDDKFFVCPSGLTIMSSNKKRDEHLLCYTSDYNRGLDILLDIWPNYLFAYPNDRLVIAYGTNNQEAQAKGADKVRGDNVASNSWKYRWQLFEKRFKMKGVTHVGKLNKQQLADLYEEASIMAYPSIFPETQCLVVGDALAHGCIPVTTSLGALQETNNGGYILHPDINSTSNNYLKRLIFARSEITEDSRLGAKRIAEQYAWGSLYKKINSEILNA